MRKGRLFQVICHLLERGQSTASDMAREFGVSVRTVYRDVETLNAAGVPVYAETGRHGGICLMKGFVLDRALLSPEERADILEAVKPLEPEFASPGPAVLQKLAGKFQLPAEDWLEVDLSLGGGTARARERFRFLQGAVMQHHCADLTCTGPGGEPVKLHVRPLKLCCRGDGWHLKAYCPTEQEYRLLPLPCIIKWKPSVDTFEPQAYPNEPEAPRQEPAKVVLRFPCELTDRVCAMFDGGVPALRKDGSMELRQELPIDEQLFSRLLALGPKVRVSSPSSLRDELASRAREISEANS